VDFATVYRLF